MSANLFDTIPNSLFSPLASKNKRIYATCLLELHTQYKITRQEDFTRAFVNNVISNCLLQVEDFFVSDESDDDTEVLSGMERPDQPAATLTENIIFHKLEKTGWLSKEIDDNNVQRIYFTDAANTMLPALSELARPGRLSLGGYTRNIIENLQAVKTARHPFSDAFWLALDCTQKFMRILDKMRNKVLQDIQKIMECDDPYEMNAMLEAYLDDNLGGDYFKIQFQESLNAGERRKIADLLSEIRDDDVLFDRLVVGAQKMYSDLENTEDAEMYIMNSIDFMYTSLTIHYEERYNRILHEQARYISNAGMKINAHTVDRRNVRGLLKDLLIEINKAPGEDWPEDEETPSWLSALQTSFAIPQRAYLAEESLYQARVSHMVQAECVEPIPVDEMSPESYLEHLRTTQEVYTPRKVSKLIHRYLSGRGQLEAEDLPLESRKEFCDLVAIILFGSDPDSEFNVEFHTDRIQKNGFDAPKFTVTLKKP